jgi:hypothetical protein
MLAVGLASVRHFLVTDGLPAARDRHGDVGDDDVRSHLGGLLNPCSSIRHVMSDSRAVRRAWVTVSRARPQSHGREARQSLPLGDTMSARRQAVRCRASSRTSSPSARTASSSENLYRVRALATGAEPGEGSRCCRTAAWEPARSREAGRRAWPAGPQADTRDGLLRARRCCPRGDPFEDPPRQRGDRRAPPPAGTRLAPRGRGDRRLRNLRGADADGRV